MATRTDPRPDAAPAPARAQATFGGGCFWCVEAVFKELDGVLAVRPGYSGGQWADPTYEDVLTGRTGHAEAVQVDFDPGRVPYARLLEVFFRTHDPTTLNRQGNDVGPQYRSVVFAHDEAQDRAAREAILALESAGAFDAPIVTEVVPFERFWPAEAYHHDYFARNPRQPYCAAVVAPKVEKFRQAFRAHLK